MVKSIGNIVGDSTLPYTNKNVFSSRNIQEIKENINVENNTTYNDNDISSTSIYQINQNSNKIINIPPFYIRNINMDDDKLLYEALIKYKQTNSPNISENRIYDYNKFNDFYKIIGEFNLNDKVLRILISDSNDDEIKFDRKKSKKETRNLLKSKFDYEEDDEVNEESLNKLNNNDKLKELFKKFLHQE